MLVPSILLFLLLKPNFGFDFIRDSLDIIDQDSDPCDDFYRHACPFKRDGKFLPVYKYEEYLAKLVFEQSNNLWENLEITKKLETIRYAELADSSVAYVTSLFQKRCENGQDTMTILARIQEMVYPNSGKCHQEDCFEPISGDLNCTRAVSTLRERIHGKMMSTSFYLRDLSHFLDSLRKDVEALSATLDDHLRGGVQQVDTFLKEMLDVLKEWIEETPWVNNQGVKDSLELVAKNINVQDNYAAEIRDNLESLFGIESEYLKCLRDVDEGEEIFCLIHAATSPKRMPGSHFFNFFQASNNHPDLQFGFHMYHMAQYVEEMAAKLGSVGFVVAHEMSHSLIEDTKSDGMRLLPFSSETANQCIQDQFNATCEEFKEQTSCVVESFQFDDNGADIMGIQLAYNLFEKYYEGRIKDEFVALEKIKINYQQLFFYSSALVLCNENTSKITPGDSHSAVKMRVNVVANHPAFQEAFQCSADSRMMKTALDQCIVFGEKAPEQKRKH